ncbi:hypothetical protein H4218_000186 [Coemansia sp. IMI 209128]|nr:hypothetical protein H4218_000186 [Coemansia sp. IMI 209128]
MNNLFSNSADFHSTAALTQSILASASASQYMPMSTANSQYPNKLSLSIPSSIDANHLLLDITTDLKKDYVMDTDEDGSPNGYTGGEGSPDPSSDAYNKKRHRLRPEQTRRLLEIFEKTNKPDSEMRKVLGKQLDMTPRTVQIWFQNRRAKIKREGQSTGSLRHAGFSPAGPLQGRNRLTFNRAFINRRPTGRVASDGFEHLQGLPGFEPHAHSALHGLPLQSPSQVSIPMDMHQQQQFAMQHFSGAPSHVFGDSAIGVPLGEHTTYHRSAPATAYPGQSMGGMDSMLGNVLPLDMHGGQQFLHQSHAYQAVPSYAFTPSHTMPLNNGHMQPLPLNIRNHQASRTRAITADSQTLAQMSRLVDPSFNDSMVEYASNFKPMLDFGSHQPHFPQGDDLLSTQASSSSVSASDDISVDALLASRRRRLEDARTIARTNAQRGKHVGSDMSFGPLPANGESMSLLGVNGAPSASNAPPPVNKAATADMLPSSTLMLPHHVYQASSNNSALHQLTSSAGHSQHASVATSGPDLMGAPLVSDVSSSDASMILGAGTSSFNLAECQILDSIFSQCEAMNVFSSIGAQEQLLKDGGASLDMVSSNDGLGELREQLFNTGHSSPTSFASVKPEPTIADLAGHNTGQSAEDSKTSPAVLPGSIGLLTKRVRPPYLNGDAAKGCPDKVVPSAPPSANDKSEQNAMLASSFLFSPGGTSMFQLDPTQYASGMAGSLHGPMADPALAKRQPSGANVVSVAANGQAGQRDLTIEQLHQLSSL